MSTTTAIEVEPPRYELYYRDNTWDNKREVLDGDKAVDTFNEIPLVDLSRIFSKDPEERKAVAQEIAGVCKRVGFMYIKNHGVSQDLIGEVFDLVRRFHDQPLEKKMEVYVYKNPELRGYNEHYTNTPEGPKLKKKSFVYSYDPENDPARPALTPAQREKCIGIHNQWPASPTSFKEKMLEYQRELLKLSRKMMHSFALGLGTDETYFDEYVTHPFISIILQHYAPIAPGAEDPDSLGAHTDFETFTILAQDQLGGLEVLNKNGKYVPAPYIPGTFVVNIGDFLERISNDSFVSTVHRVRNTSGKERYSIPFFFSFNMEADMGVIPACTSPENSAKYGTRNLHDYTANMRKLQKKQHEDPGLDDALA
ncbi:hypothetical protein F5Y15DRAFT_305384 [Xylariaceae sp. FL0016]|nr:hypothetical protein F5Y15DRAFT_305384 [Xylariaceae sp. FL0016]